MAGWVYDYCGETGIVPKGEVVESVLCPTCGEPVLPWPECLSHCHRITKGRGRGGRRGGGASRHGLAT